LTHIAFVAKIINSVKELCPFFEWLI